MTAIELRVTPACRCGRCGREGLLALDIPSAWIGARGQIVSGRRSVVLCAHCDRDAPAAGPLIAWLAVDEVVDDALIQFAEYVRAWVQEMIRAPDPDGFAQDEARWRRGGFD